jgi:hypothetical protein
MEESQAGTRVRGLEVAKLCAGLVDPLTDADTGGSGAGVSQLSNRIGIGHVQAVLLCRNNNGRLPSETRLLDNQESRDLPFKTLVECERTFCERRKMLEMLI